MAILTRIQPLLRPVSRSLIPQSCLPGRRHIVSNSRFFKVSEEVQQAVAERRPVVALETTIYTHGFPYPDNLSLASDLESLIRQYGGVPATIGILDGIARVGFQKDELDRLVSTAGNAETMKISRRDFGFTCGLTDTKGRRFNGGTTIAGTMILAHMAGIKIFGTGGLGGVHRGAETSMDVSADLTELGRTPVAVISSGCKSFLDLPKTLEVLETHGVAVATFSDGRSGSIDFPGFYTRESGVPSPKVLKNEVEAANVLHAHFSMGLQSGLNLANPIPEKHSVPKEIMEAAIFEAVEHAHIAGAVGAAITPHILKKIKEVTGDRSIVANRALIESNVARATKVATELARLERGEAEANEDGAGGSVVKGPAASGFTKSGAMRSLNAWAAQQPPADKQETPSAIGGEDSLKDALATFSQAFNSLSEVSASQGNQSLPTESSNPAPCTTGSSVFVAGSLAIDLSCDYALQNHARAAGDAVLKPALNTSNPAEIRQSLGGVGSNVARAAHLIGADVKLCSAVGSDLGGKAALEALTEAGMDTSGIKTLSPATGGRTAQYVAVNDSSKDLVLAMADMSILESTSTDAGSISNALDTFWLPQLQSTSPSHLVLDANWPAAHLSKWLAAFKATDTKAYTTFEPVSNAKCTAPFRLPTPHTLSTFPNPSIDLTTPNRYELAAMHTAAREAGHLERADWWSVIDALGIPSSGARTQMALATSNQLVDQGIPQQSVQLLPFFPAICTKLGSEGILLTQILSAGDPRLTSGEYAPYILSRCGNGTEDTLGIGGVYMRLFPAIEAVGEEEVVSVNGVGDTFVGTLVAGLAKAKKGGKEGRVEDFIDIAQRAAVLTLKSRESVAPGLGTLGMLL